MRHPRFPSDWTVTGSVTVVISKIYQNPLSSKENNTEKKNWTRPRLQIMSHGNTEGKITTTMEAGGLNGPS